MEITGTRTRREQLLDAALHLLVEEGTYGLTHRKIDARASFPVGTTSNYFRTRSALARAVVRAISLTDAEWHDLEVDEDAARDRDALLLAWLRRQAEVLLGPYRLHALAWYRLMIEGSADPEVRAEITAEHARILDATKAIVVRCGSTSPDEHAAMVRTFLGAFVLFQNARTDATLDRVLVPMARGLTHVIERDAGAADVTA